MTTSTNSNALIYTFLSFAIVTILLLVDLPILYASNINLDNTIQNKFEFEDSINLTNNERDSVYGQISTSNNKVYLVWQESVPGSNTRNYDILFKHSTDNGKRFHRKLTLAIIWASQNILRYHLLPIMFM